MLQQGRSRERDPGRVELKLFDVTIYVLTPHEDKRRNARKKNLSVERSIQKMFLCIIIL